MNIRHLGLAIVLSTLAIGAAAASSDGTWTAPGPVVGQPFAHTLDLRDHSGAERSLQSLQGDHGVVLVFVRSADWCPFCKRQLAELNQRLAEFDARRLAVVSISVDPVEKIAAFQRLASIKFTLLADSDGAVVQALGIRDHQYPGDSAAFGVPHPMIFVIDRTGVVRAKFAERGYRSRPDLDAVLAEIDRLKIR
jgi:peroxiredoxin